METSEELGAVYRLSILLFEVQNRDLLNFEITERLWIDISRP